MDKQLEEELMARLQHGKTTLSFESILGAIKYGDQITRRYLDHPQMSLDENVLRIVTDHKENLIPLAKLILELKGWLATHTEEILLRPVIQKRVFDLSNFMIRLMMNIRVIAEMPTLEELIAEETLKPNSAKMIAKEILSLTNEVTSFVTNA